jgi:hypothetical protein
MHCSEIKPSPPGPTFMMELMELGAFGAQLCQVLKTRAAFDCDSIHEMSNTKTSVSGKMRKTNWVAIPKLPPPPPLQAQNKSGSMVAVVCRVRPCALIMVACWRLSQVSRATWRATHILRPARAQQCRPFGNFPPATRTPGVRASDKHHRAKPLLQQSRVPHSCLP